MIGNATVTRVRQTFAETDAYGNPLDPVEHRVEIPGCAFAPAKASRFDTEIRGRGRQGDRVTGFLFCPPGTDLLFTDRVEIAGELFDIDGEPGAFDSPFGPWRGGVQAELRRTQG